MIQVKKRLGDCPPVLKTKGIEEQKANIGLIRAGRKGEVKFRLYKHPDVLETLTRLFQEKCAYCEAKAAYVAPWDVEHFRPKSRTLKKGTSSKFIGYYWLAAEWDNLLPSCIQCNRPKRHTVPGRSDKILIGKHEQFPLDEKKEKLRCTSPASPARLKEEDKVRLLIHPCRENPEAYFVFVTDGPFPGDIRPRKELRGYRLRKAEKSIEVYALHRIDLVKKRGQLITNLQQRILAINNEIEHYNKSKGKHRTRAAQNIATYIDHLLDYALPDKEFSALAKQVVGDYLSTLDKSIKALISKN